MERKQTNNQGAPKLKVLGDLVWSIAALVIMNGVIQIVIYPALNRKLGAEAYGDVLYLMSIASVFSAGIGMASNNARLLRQNGDTAGNGNYLAVMLLFLAPSLMAVWALTREYVQPLDFILLAMLTLFMTLRYYSDAEYRLALNYRRYFVYYGILSVGYLTGLMLWDVLPVWQLVFLLGEAGCVLFCAAGGRIYHPMKCTPRNGEVVRLVIQLAPSYLLNNFLVQMDRIMLRSFIDSRSVTIYYVASLLGKVIALLVGPLNSIVISYLTRSSVKLRPRTLVGLVCSFLAVGAVLFAGVCFASPIVIRMLYPDIYAPVMEISAWANLSQIVCFSASLVLTVLLTVAPAYWQMITQSAHAVLFIAGGCMGLKLGGLRGFVFATLFANGVHLAATFVVLLVYALKKDSRGEGAA